MPEIFFGLRKCFAHAFGVFFLHLISAKIDGWRENDRMSNRRPIGHIGLLVLAGKQRQRQCPHRYKITAYIRRPHTPSIKAASEIAAASLQWQFHADRLNVKKRYKRLRFSPTPKKGLRGKAQGLFPAGREAARGEVSGRKPAGAERGGRRAVKPRFFRPQPSQASACRTQKRP